MPIPAYMDFGDFPGSCQVAGREDMVQVLGFSHQVYIPTDPKDGSTTGTRVHGALGIVKNYDKASPKLYEYLCNGKKIPEVLLHWYMIDPDTGQETEYFTHKLEDVIVVSMKPWMPNVDEQKYKEFKHMEEVSLRYAKITWTFVDGNIEFMDSWLEGR